MYDEISFPVTNNIKLDSLFSSELSYPVVLIAPRGRPKNNIRLEKKTLSMNMCSKCHNVGHNARSCPQPAGIF